MIKNYTTSIATEKTVGEIMQLVARMGAVRTQIEYGPSSECAAMSFCLKRLDRELYFKIAPSLDGVLKTLEEDGAQKRYRTQEHAEKVAWRIEKDWVEAQWAKIQAGSADAVEVFLPYLLVDRFETLYDRFTTNPQLLLGDGSSP